jgi:hypothetical protein
MAFRLRVSSSSNLEQIGVTLGVVVGVEGAMVSLLLLLIVACICGAAQLSRKISRRQKSVRWARSSKRARSVSTFRSVSPP